LVKIKVMNLPVEKNPRGDLFELNYSSSTIENPIFASMS